MRLAMNECTALKGVTGRRGRGTPVPTYNDPAQRITVFYEQILS